MINIIMQRECGCIIKSAYKRSQTFSNIDDAVNTAKNMCEDMNKNFCSKHKFTFINNNNEIIIKMEIKK